MAEEQADDEALYDVWRRLTPVEVDLIHDLVALVAERVRDLRGKRPTAEMVEAARGLRDGPLHLGYLPVVQTILDEQ